MKIENEPWAYGFLAGLFVMFVGVLANASCTYVRGRDPQIAFESTALITVVCLGGEQAAQMYGSGVIVDRQTILTAAHVATSPPGFFCVRTATMVTGKRYLLTAGKALPAFDLASLKLAVGEFDPTYPVSYGDSPHFGAHVCAATAYPQHLWRCGETQTSTDPPGDVAHSIVVEPGNSGSGVYDERGRLVGIITHRWSCFNGQLCGGKMASLAGHVKELL